jgi:transketolase C-terminal domain/subunit
VKKDKTQAGLAKAAIRAAQDGLPVFSISADVQGSTGISTFQKSLPDRFIEVGIAEAHMISSGAGFAKAGFVPIVDTFGQFGVTKGNLPLTMAALSQAPVIAIFSHVGFQDAADGASHQATTYLAAVSAIPHTVVICPSCADEAEALMYEAIKRQAADRHDGKDGDSYVFFVGRENYPLHWVEGASYPWGKAQVLQQGTDVVLIGSGVLVNKAIEAGKAGRARSEGDGDQQPVHQPVDLDTIGAAVKAVPPRGDHRGSSDHRRHGAKSRMALAAGIRIASGRWAFAGVRPVGLRRRTSLRATRPHDGEDDQAPGTVAVGSPCPAKALRAPDSRAVCHLMRVCYNFLVMKHKKITKELAVAYAMEPRRCRTTSPRRST